MVAFLNLVVLPFLKTQHEQGLWALFFFFLAMPCMPWLVVRILKAVLMHRAAKHGETPHPSFLKEVVRRVRIEARD